MKNILTVFILLGGFLPGNFCLTAQSDSPPNIIIIITDDQGYGDLGYHKNPAINTPTIDAFAKKSIRFTNFHVSPVCAPTRSSLMTGRYSLRTGVRDTYNGGAIMATNEITIAEMLKEKYYSTGIFGKWHLGDNYPSRPMDQGFDESLIHLSGGMGQVGDFTTYFKKDSSYFDPVLWHNGLQEKFNGYCSDIFTDNAISFIEENKDDPFFCYLSFNAPHTPLQVPQEYYDKYADTDPSLVFDQNNNASRLMSEKDKEDARKVYAMVENIDDNVNRLFKKLDDLGIKENTLIIFMTDNGPQQLRYVGGMKGLKGSVYNGGNRVPFYINYPASFQGDRDIDITSAHIDILPTIAELCQLELPVDRKIDGKSLLPLINKQNVDWEDRSLFFYWTRRYPELYNNIAIRRGDYKLVGFDDYDADIIDFELYNIKEDPNEESNIISDHIDLGKGLKSEMELIYKNLITSKNLIHQPPIIIGTSNENPTFLNRNDADGNRGIWAQEEVYGKWNVEIEEGIYNLKFKFIKKVNEGGKMYLETNGIVHQKNINSGGDIISMNNVKLPDIQGELIPFYQVDGRRIFPFWVEMERVNK